MYISGLFSYGENVCVEHHPIIRSHYPELYGYLEHEIFNYSSYANKSTHYTVYIF